MQLFLQKQGVPLVFVFKSKGLPRLKSQGALTPLTVVQNNNYDQLSRDILHSGRNIVKAIKSQPRPKTLPPNYMKWWIGSRESGESFYRRMNGN